jgi:hypothetical protein
MGVFSLSEGIMNGINKGHLAYVIAGVMIFLLSFMGYGMVQEAFDEEWMDFAFSQPEWKPYIIGALIILGAVMLFLKMGNYFDKYDTWMVFLGITSLVIAAFLWWYWYRVLPEILAIAVSGGAAGLLQRKFRAAQAALGPADMRNNKASAPGVNVIIAVAIVVASPFIVMWIEDYYSFSGSAYVWFRAVFFMLEAYIMCFALDLHK